MATTAASFTLPPLTLETDIPRPTQLPFQDLTPITTHASPPTTPSPPAFLNSIAELKDLSAAISAFQQCYDDLHNLLDSIKAAILAKLPPEAPQITRPTASSSPKPEAIYQALLQKQHEENPQNSKLLGLCKTMCSRGVRKYLVTHLCDLPMLREEVPKVLRQAPNPPKLVIECLGKFFLQGSKAFTRDSPMIPAREASILILECFLLMIWMDAKNGKDGGLLNIEKAVKEDADRAAMAWRKRLVSEGGLAKASQIDARGLLLFVACFGIPAVFKLEDIRDLAMAANAEEIMDVLQKSRVLMSKISEIVEEMIKKNMEINAVDMIYTFGLEERFNLQTVLVSFLRVSEETWKKSIKESHGSPATLNKANKKHLAALKSISECLERHKIDPAMLLPGWQIDEKIITIEKDIADSDRKTGEKITQKRKSSETETSKKPKSRETKRQRYAGHGAQQQKAAGPVDNRRNFSVCGPPKHANYYSASQSLVYGGPGAGLVPESMLQPGVGVGVSASHGGVLSTYAGAHAGVLVDAAGQLIDRGTHPYVWHRESAINERYVIQPSVGLTTLYTTSTSKEGFAGNASLVGLGTRGSASDLYQFTDSIAETELYSSSVPRGV